VPESSASFKDQRQLQGLGNSTWFGYSTSALLGFGIHFRMERHQIKNAKSGMAKPA
jgi:hypothetical protein